MIRALNEDPEAFEARGNRLHHRPSRHWLSFDAKGNTRIFARCSCAELPVSPEQSAELWTAVSNWKQTY